MPDVPTLREVMAARPRVYRHLRRTPLHPYPGLSKLLGAEVWVKHENHHAVGAFKVRGGVNLASLLDEKERRAGLFTASTGNHGQSIAFGARVAGTRATVAAPENANPSKVASMRALGAEVILRGADFDEAREWILERAREEGARFVGPTDPELIAGVGTYSLEILEDLPEVDVIVVPVGAGSGAASVCLVARSVDPRIRVIAVQAERAASVQRSWREGRRVELPMETAAEGLATRVPFENTLHVLRDPAIGLDDFVLVSDAALEEAIRLLLEHSHNLAEHAGAAPLAAALQVREALRGQRVVLVLSGGNLSMRDARSIMAG